MKILLAAQFVIFVVMHGVAQIEPPAQKVFCQFISAFNRQDLDTIYQNLCPDFQAKVDRAVCIGGLSHVYRSNGTVHSVAIETQTINEGVYYAIAEQGVFKVFLSVDSLQRIDGLRIKQVERNVVTPLTSFAFQPGRGQ